MRWDDLNARVRGLAGHLLGRSTIQSMAAENELDGLLRRLRDGPYDVGLRGAPAGALTIDLSVRRAAGHRLATISRWSGRRRERLRVLFEEEDRRSVRALLRGAVGGARPEARVAGLLPTPGLPERALEELARQPTAAKVAALLVAWGNAYGSAVFEHAVESRPDLFAMELALARTFALRTRAAARRGALRRFAQDAIDAENIASAVALAGRRIGTPIEEVFLAGGRALALDGFVAAAHATDAEGALLRLTRAAGMRTPLGRTLAAAAPDTLEQALLVLRTRALRRGAREHPIGPSLILGYALRLRGEVMDLRTIAWGLALRAPRALVLDQLVTQ